MVLIVKTKTRLPSTRDENQNKFFSFPSAPCPSEPHILGQKPPPPAIIDNRKSTLSSFETHHFRDTMRANPSILADDGNAISSRQGNKSPWRIRLKNGLLEGDRSIRRKGSTLRPFSRQLAFVIFSLPEAVPRLRFCRPLFIPRSSLISWLLHATT